MSYSEWIKKKREDESSKTTTTTSESSSGTTSRTASSQAGNTGSKPSYSDWIRSKKETSSVQYWAQSASNLINEAHQFYSNWNNDEEQYTRFQDRTSSLLALADGWRKQYAGNDEAVSQIDSIVSALTDTKYKVSDFKKYYSNWDTEDDYQASLRAYGYHQKYSGMSWEEIQSVLNELEDGEEKEWLSTYQYELIPTAEDFDSRSSEGWKRYLEVQAGTKQSQQDAKENESFWDKLGRWLGPAGPTDTSIPLGNAAEITHNLAADTSYQNPSDDWTEDQKAIYGYLYSAPADENGASDVSEAAKYAHITNESNNQAENAKKIAAIEEWATKNGWTGTAATLGAIAMMPLSLADTLSVLTEYNARGFVSTSSTPLPGQVSNAITSAISTVLNEKSGTINDSIPVIGGKGVGDAYQLGTSIANSMISAYTQGGLGTYIVFFGSASSSAMYDAKNRGATDEQAITFGVLSGLAEAAGEAFSVEKLLNLSGVDELSSFFGNVLLQAGIEATEEGVTTLLNNFSEQLVLGDKSNFNILVQQYMSEGRSEDEAKKKAWKSMANDLAFDMLGGFISGGVSSGLQTGVKTMFVNRIENQNAQQIYGADPGALVNEALEINPDNGYAQKMQGRLDSGKQLSGGQLNRLVKQNEAALAAQDISSIQSAAESRLAELGETGDVKSIAAALTKQAAGKKLSRSEQQAISNSKYAQRVANELNPENIRSGEYSSGWAENIDTQRINVDEYSRLLEAAQLPQEAAETTGDQVVTETQNEAQPVQTAAVESSTANYQQVTEEASATEETKTVTLEDASKKYGAQAQAMVHTYQQGQDVEKYDAAYRAAYDMGKSGVSLDYVKGSQAVSYLTDNQKELAYEAGVAVSDTAAKKLDAQNKAASNGKTGRRKGVIKGEGVTIADLKKTFNDTQGKAYKYLSTVAEVTGIDIVLYRSEAGPDGEFQGAQGRYSRSEPGTIYIDLNAGLSNINSADDLAKYAMLRTFSHEFTHFIEKWNPIQYNEFRKVVFDTLTQRGENVHDLIKEKQARNPGMDYDKASREVVAEAMTDILPNANFVQELAEKHKTIFQKLLDQLKEFVANLRDYFNSIGHNRSNEANALKEQVGETVKYLDSIVQLFDNVAVQAVENYQQTVAIEEQNLDTIDDETVQRQSRAYLGEDFYDTDGVHWGIEAGVMTTTEARKVWEAIANIGKRGYYYPRTVSGEHIISADNALFFVKADYRYPSVNKIIRFNTEYEVNAGYAKELIIDAQGNPARHREALRDVADLYGEGFALEYDRAVYAADARENRRGEGKNRRTSDSGIAEQEQQRTDTLTDRDILDIAEKRGITETLSAGQVSTLQIFNKKNAEIGELLKQKAKQEKTLKDLQGTAKPDKQEIFKTQNRIKTIEGQIKRESAKLREYETMDSLKGILEIVKPTVEKKLIEERKEELAKYGTIPKGEKAVRASDLPTTTDGKNKVSRTARTVYEARVTPDDFADLIDKEVYLNNGLTYLPITNNATVQKATEYIQKVGWTKAMQQWQADVLAGKASAEMSAIGALLLNNAAKAGDKNTWMDILYSYQMMGTNAAQATQALRILKNLQPADKLYLIRKSIDQMVRDMHLGFNVEIDPNVEEAYRNAQTYEEENLYLSEIQQSIADQIPSTFMDKWTALRYVNMLGNFRTQIRNVTGNLGMKAVTAFKDTVALGLERIAYKASGGRFKKTKSLIVSREMLKAAKADYILVESVIQGGGKYSDTVAESTMFARSVLEKRTIFKNKLLEGYRKGTNWLMDRGDVLFSKPAYARALAGYLKANGITTSDYSKVDDILMNDARLYAIKEAQEATFRDTNILSGWLSQLGRKTTTPAFAKVISEGVVPFRKTPANVLVRAEEYSPLGILNSVWITAHQVAGQTRLTQLTESNSNLIKSIGKFAQSGQEITGAEVINSWAKSLTGTGLFALGMLLHSFGVLVGGPDDDEGLDKFEALNGQQNYALKIGDLYITIDWMSPAAMPLFMGGQLNKLRQEGGIELKDIESALSSIADPLIQMSMLQGVNDTLENIQYAESNMGQLLINSAVSYLTQGLTNTMLGQLERGFEEQRMSTYVNKNSALPNWLQKAIGKASAKTPGLDYNQIPYINAWGQEEQNPETVLNLIYNMLSPSYISKEKNDAVSQELIRLNEVNSSAGSVFPSTPEKTIKSYTDSSGVEHKDYNLSAEEYVALAKAQGQMQRQIIESMISSNLYKELPDEYKVKSVQFAYDYARESAQIEVLDRDGFSSDWMAEIQGNTAEGIVKHVIQKNIKGMFLAGDISADEAIQRQITYYGDSAEEAAEKVDYWKFQAANPNYADWSESTVTRFKDLDVETAAHVVEVLDGLSPESGSTNVRTIQELEAIAGDNTLSNQDKNAALRAIMDDKLEAKFDSALNMGISMSNFTLAYRKYLDTEGKGKKATVTAYYRKNFGITETKAEKLYDLFAGKK